MLLVEEVVGVVAVGVGIQVLGLCSSKVIAAVPLSYRIDGAHKRYPFSFCLGEKRTEYGAAF